ncbi:12298_t:CDS:2 [Cetraspora pellucida]|uniref:12298_t:CDS:1 n=1 Tax=Cetraspora pellucida TaxID=1433469 RepID=A0A9N9HSA4_9GLOM|nr:12298_t:CDS:2 [Cetraspora pellucida]
MSKTPTLSNELTLYPFTFLPFYEYEISPNAAPQKAAYEKIKVAKAKIIEFKSLFNLAMDVSIQHDLSVRIQENKDVINECSKKVDALKQYTNNQARMDGPRRPSMLAQNSDLLENIHDCVEFSEADQKHRKSIIKVRTIIHLKKAFKEKYKLYISKQTLLTYLWPKHSNTFSAKWHHHPAMVQIWSVSQNKKSDHSDSHYCLASVKGARTFVSSFSDYSIIISQDDKAKVPLRILALIPSVYLLINPKDTNDNFHLGHLSIYIWPEYFVSTTAATHIANLILIINSKEYNEFIYTEDKVKPLWILLMDGRSDENPKHLKNIIEYSGIVLPIDHFGAHLNSQGKVIDEELVIKNFHFSGEKLCDIW